MAVEGRGCSRLGSSKEGSAHKGYGLAIWVGFPACCRAGFGDMMGADNMGQFFGAFRIDAFIPYDDFTASMDTMVRTCARRPAPGFDRVMVAGQPEWESSRSDCATASRSTRWWSRGSTAGPTRPVCRSTSSAAESRRALSW